MTSRFNTNAAIRKHICIHQENESLHVTTETGSTPNTNTPLLTEKLDEAQMIATSTDTKTPRCFARCRNWYVRNIILKEPGCVLPGGWVTLHSPAHPRYRGRQASVDTSHASGKQQQARWTPQRTSWLRDSEAGIGSRSRQALAAVSAGCARVLKQQLRVAQHGLRLQPPRQLHAHLQQRVKVNAVLR